MLTRVRLKPIREQVVVVTGASSGIGLATAELAAARGARVVLSSFDEPALREATERIRRRGGEAIGLVADVTDRGALEHVAEVAARTYGRIDTWFNNAGVHIFGEIGKTSLRDMRRVVDVNYWGVVNGSRAAVPHLARSGGGALLNMGSVLSSRSVPLQGIYGASKHAVKAYTDALRMELEVDGAPVVVTLIAPSAIHTPIVQHSKSLMAERAQLPPPMYGPGVAARAVVRCMEKARRDLVIGGAGKVAVVMEKFAPTLTDELMMRALVPLQKAKGPRREEDTLHGPRSHPPEIESPDRRFVLRHSTYTWSVLHPFAAMALAVAAVGGAAWLGTTPGLRRAARRAMRGRA